MKTFPVKLRVENRTKCADFCYERNLCYLRQELYELMIQGNENDYFDIGGFGHRRLRNDPVLLERMRETVTQELTAMGWTCTSSHAGTALFIYSGEMPPSCYPDGF